MIHDADSRDRTIDHEASFDMSGCKPLSAAERAQAEAVARRPEIDRKTAERPAEISGRGSLEPCRYGDWEVKGIASDF